MLFRTETGETYREKSFVLRRFFCTGNGCRPSFFCDAVLTFNGEACPYGK